MKPTAGFRLRFFCFYLSTQARTGEWMKGHAAGKPALEIYKLIFTKFFMDLIFVGGRNNYRIRFCKCFYFAGTDFPGRNKAAPSVWVR